MIWTRIARPESIPLHEGRNVFIGERELAIFNLGNKFAAIDAACPHRGGPLCDGIVTGAPSLAGGPVKGHAVVCPLHGWKVDLNTGNVLKPDVSVKVETYEVRLNEGVIEVNLPEFDSREKAA
jgi:nitrite reductase (NADH) small subunit